MALESWESHNLARHVLARICRDVQIRLSNMSTAQQLEDDSPPSLTPPMRRRRACSERLHVPHYRRFARPRSRSSSIETFTDDRDGLVFLPRRRSSDSFITKSLTYLSETTESGSADSKQRALFRDRLPCYRRFSRTTSMNCIRPFVWMNSEQFTPQMGKLKIIEYIRTRWTSDPKMKYFVDHIRAVPLPGHTRHKYATTWRTPFTSRVIYFTFDVSTIHARLPVQVTFTFPNGKRQHRPDTARRHFESFMRSLYPYDMQGHA